MLKSADRIQTYLCVLFLAIIVVVCIGFATEAKAESTTRIYTVEDLYAINSDMDGNYILMNDIDLSAATAKDGDWDFMGNGWEPIGSGGKYGNTEFTGTFDGNGYAIRGMRIDVSNSLPSGCDNIYIGLFANNGGTIKNLTIFKDSNISVSIKSHNVYCGSIAAYNSGAIESCDSSAHVQCDCINGKTKSSSKYYTYAGGLIGYSKGALNHCSSRGDIRCYNYGSTDFWRQGSIQGDMDTYSYQQVIGYYGGVVGFQTGNSVDFCLNTSDISVKTETRGSGSSITKSISASVGGIYGGGDGAVNNSYNAGNIKGYDDNAENSSVVVLSGGIIGKSTSNSNSVANCYSSGMIECGTGYAISGNTDLTINDCFYLSTGAKTQDGASALTAGQFKASSCFTGFDFDNVWLMDSDSDYVQPQLKGNRQDNKDIELVELSVEPTVKEYYADSEIDPEGGEVKVYYKDGTRDTKDITKTMLRDYDMSVIGEQDVIVNYRDFTSTYKINIVERPEIENMTLISEPTKKEFVKGTEFDFTGCQVKVDYVGGKTETIDVTAKATEGGNINKLGNQTITYTLLDKSVEFTVKVIPVEIESIAVENMPTQTVFVEGKTVKTDGLAIKAIYNNGEEQLVDGYVLGELPTSIGKHQIQVSYSGCTTYFEVEIIEKSAVSISIKNEPEKTSYVIGQKLDTTGMVVEATFDNDDVLEVTDYTVGDLPETVGFGKVEIEYQGQKAYVTVSMKEKVLESISVAQMPDKVNYIQDEDFDQTGLKICANYNNGNSEEITDFTLTNKSTSKAGKKNVTVLYDGFTTTFEITVVEKTVLSITVTPPSKLSYIEGEELDTTGMVVSAKFDNGKTEEVTDYEVSGFGDSDEESNIITVSYNGVRRSFVVTIHTPESDWRITTPATCTTGGEKKLYCAGCNELLKTETIDALGHDWSEWEAVTSPNCTDKGSKKRVCSRCQEVEFKDVDPNGHSWNTEEYVVDKEPTCVEEGVESIHCSVCGVKQEGSERTIQALGHDYGEWSAVKEASCTETGREERTCSVCGSVDFKEIAAIGHNWGEATYTWTNDNSTVTATRTCSNDGLHMETETVKTTAKVTKNATYTAKGQTTFTAVFTNDAFSTQTKVVTNVPKLAKKANTLNVKPRTATVKYSKVMKKTQTVKRAKAVTVSKPQGTVSYKLTGVTKAKFKKYFKVNAKTGNITVKKKLKKGTYKLRIKVTAAGTTAYKVGSKTVTVTIKVK